MSLCCLRNVNFAFKNIIIKGNLDLLRAGFYMSKNNSYQTNLCCLDSFRKKDQINEKKKSTTYTAMANCLLCKRLFFE